MYMKRKEEGIAIGAVLVIVALIAAVSVYLASGSRSRVEDPAGASNQLRSSAVLSQASALRDGFNVMVVRGTAPAAITADATATGLYNPTTGGASPQSPSADLFANPAAPSEWAIGTATVANIGTATADRILFLEGLNDNVCASINTQLHGSATIPSVTATAMGAAANFANSGNPGRMEGCVELGTTGTNVYYNVVTAL